MKVAIVGGSGLVGRALTRSLVADGADVVVLSRDARRRRAKVPARAHVIDWSATDVEALARSIAGVDAVVDLAGARVAPWLWTRRRKALIRSSRVDGIHAIVEALARLPEGSRPATLVVVSGVDAYPESGPGADPVPMTESTPIGAEFLARVAREMEDEASPAEALGVRVIAIRMGNVLATDADLVRLIALPVRLFLGGRIGSGQQWMSWVHMDDVVALFRLALTSALPGGVLNVTSPGACRQIEFVRAMAGALRRPARFPAPAVLVRLVLGEQSTLLLGSRRVAPERAIGLGYVFRFPMIDEAFRDVLG